MVIERAVKADAAVILGLQYRAYQSEADLYHNQRIPPLLQTLDEITTEFDDHIFLKATVDSQLVGSVRAHVKDDTGFIGRLIVEPTYQRRGIGTALMAAIEKELPEVARFELFTGTKSEQNLSLYRKLGYEPCREEQIAPGLVFVYLQKPHAEV